MPDELPTTGNLPGCGGRQTGHDRTPVTIGEEAARTLFDCVTTVVNET